MSKLFSPGKYLYHCPSCNNAFSNKNLLKRHFERIKGCQSAEAVLSEIVIDKLERLDKNFEIYELNFLCLSEKDKTDVFLLKDRYMRLSILKRNILRLQSFIENFCATLYDTEDKKAAINEVIKEFFIRFENMKAQYVQDKSRNIANTL